MLGRIIGVWLVCAVASLASGTVPASVLAGLPPGLSINAVTVDSAGNYLFAGQAIPQGPSFSKGDAFVARLTAAGNLVYLKTLGGVEADGATAVAADSAGNAYITGYTQSAEFPITAGAWQTSLAEAPGSQLAGFVAKIGPTGAILYSTFLNSAYGQAIAVNAAGEAFVTGPTNGKLTPTPGAPEFGFSKSYFILRLAAAGDRPIFALLGPGGTAIVLDTRNNLYVAGTGFDQGDIPTTPGAFQQHTTPSACGGGAQFQIPCAHQYICKMDADGTKLAFCTYVSGKSGDAGAGIAVDGNGDIYMAGSTTSTDFPLTPDAAQSSNVSAAPPYPVNPPVYPSLYQFFPLTGYFAKLSGDGSRLLYSTYIGGSQRDQLIRLALDDTGVYVTARVDSPDFPGLPGATRRCLPSRLHDMPVLLRIDAATHAILSETVIEGTPPGSVPLLAVNPQHAALVESGSYAALVPQVSAAISDGIVCITDAADFTQAAPVAPGQLLSMFGANIGPATPAVYDPNSPDLPTSLGGVTVVIDGVPAPLLYASADQINFVAPYAAAGSSMFLKVTKSGRASYQWILQGAAINPGLLTFGNSDYPACQGLGLFNSTGAAVYNEDGSMNSCDRPAAAGSLVSVVLNGTGLLAPQVSDDRNKVERVAPVPGQPLGVWQVFLRLRPDARGYAYSSLRVFGVPAREQNVAIWVSPPQD